LIEDPNIDMVMPWFVFVNIPLQQDIIEKLGALNHLYKKPILVGAFGGEYSIRMMDGIEAQGFPVYHSVCDWVSAAKAISWRSQHKL